MLVCPLVDVVGRADVLEQPVVERVGVAGEVLVETVTDVALLAERLHLRLDALEFVHHGAAGVGRLLAPGSGGVEQFPLAGLERAEVLLVVDEFPGRVTQGLALLVTDVDVAHRGLPAEHHGPYRGLPGDGAGVADELAHLLVDVRRDHDRLVVLAGVLERRHQCRERLARPTGSLEEDVSPLAEGVVDAAHRLALVVVRLLEREKTEVLGFRLGLDGPRHEEGFPLLR